MPALSPKARNSNDRLAHGLDDSEQKKRLVGEPSELTHTQALTAALSEEQQPIEALAEIGFDGQVESVTLYRASSGELLDPTPVEPGNSVWRTIEIWWEHMRTTWSDDGWLSLEATSETQPSETEL